MEGVKIKKGYLKITIEFLGIVTILFLSVSQWFGYKESEFYNKIITEFDEKNEILSNYQREYMDMYMEDNWNGEDMGVQADRLNQVRDNIRYYNSKVGSYSVIKGILFLFGLITLVATLLLYVYLINQIKIK